MTDEAGGRGGFTVLNGGQPRSLDELWALRTDYEDVTVADLGGQVLRLYALTGTARARLMSNMADLAELSEDSEARKDPAVVERVLMFQTRVVAASMGYQSADWDALGNVLGSATIESLYEVAARLSALDAGEQDKATARLRRRRSAASGTA